MDKSRLYEIVNQYGGHVISFSDHPDFFSSWSLKYEKGNKIYLIELDGRDGWLFFYVETEPNKYNEKDKVVSFTLGYDDIINQCKTWLALQ
jgi:hypothetical protein